MNHRPKYIPNSNEEPRRFDKEAIARTLMTFADEPLSIKTIAELSEVPLETVHQLTWRMAKAQTKWPNIRRADSRGSYVWVTRVSSNPRKARKARKVATITPTPKAVVKPAPKPVATKPTPVAPAPAPAPTTWTSLAQVDGKHILKHSDGSVWVASRLDV